MQSKILSKQLWFFAGIGGILVSLMMVLHLSGRDHFPKPIALIKNNVSENMLATVGELSENAGEHASSGVSMRLNIPRLHLHAPVERVGLTKAGAVDTPKGPMNPAWFDLGPRPGEKGSAVIVGHFGWKDGLPAVFDDLDQLKTGDTFSVEDEKGIMVTFVVRTIHTYRKDEDASDVFISNDGKAHLNLITCSGVWNNEEKSYAQRLVVFADSVTK